MGDLELGAPEARSGRSEQGDRAGAEWPARDGRSGVDRRERQAPQTGTIAAGSARGPTGTGDRARVAAGYPQPVSSPGGGPVRRAAVSGFAGGREPPVRAIAARFLDG